MHRRQFAGIGWVSRVAFMGFRGKATAGAAAAFLDGLNAHSHGPVSAIQVDRGSENMAGFEDSCKQRQITFYVIPPRTPKINGRVERLDGTARREFWEC